MEVHSQRHAPTQTTAARLIEYAASTEKGQDVQNKIENAGINPKEFASVFKRDIQNYLHALVLSDENVRDNMIRAARLVANFQDMDYPNIFATHDALTEGLRPREKNAFEAKIMEYLHALRESHNGYELGAALYIFDISNDVVKELYRTT